MATVWFRKEDLKLLEAEVARFLEVEGIDVAPGEAVKLLILEVRQHRQYRERMGSGPRPL